MASVPEEAEATRLGTALQTPTGKEDTQPYCCLIRRFDLGIQHVCRPTCHYCIIEFRYGLFIVSLEPLRELLAMPEGKPLPLN
jgi:hypothetical protein